MCVCVYPCTLSSVLVSVMCSLRATPVIPVACHAPDWPFIVESLVQRSFFFFCNFLFFAVQRMEHPQR